MPRGKSAVLSPADKKASLKALKAEVKAANDAVKAAEKAKTALEKTFAKSHAAADKEINKLLKVAAKLQANLDKASA